MGRKKTELTQAQIDFRASILKSKIRRPKKDTVPANDSNIDTTLHYVKNCMHWINEYSAGRVSEKELLNVAFAMRRHMSDLILLLSQPEPTPKNNQP